MFVGKSPEEIKKKSRTQAANASNLSRTLSLNSDLNFMVKSSFRDSNMGSILSPYNGKNKSTKRLGAGLGS
jgi:hypothetical protein